MAWIEKATLKIKRSPGQQSNVVALTSLRQCINKKKCVLKTEDIKPLFEAAADSPAYNMLIQVAIFYGEFLGDSDTALKLLEKAVILAEDVSLTPRLNYAELLINEDTKAKAKRVLSDDEIVGYRINREQRKRLSRVLKAAAEK